MKSHKIITAFILIAILLISACKKDENNNPSTISVEQETDIVETGFTINWSVNTTDIQQITIEISKDKDLNTVIETKIVTNTSQTSQKLEDLEGATTYYYKIYIELNNGNKLISDIYSVTTGYVTDAIKITTSDGINLAGKLKYLAANETKKPGIIFMHELRALGNEWNNAELVTDLIARGYVCLILDFRGHFLSDYVPLPTEQSEVEPFIYEVSKDLIAAVEFMKTHEKVDGDNLSLIGGSLGAIMAIAGNGYPEVKTSVALSGSTLGMYSVFPDLVVNSTFFIAAENDVTSQGINFATESQFLFQSSEDPKKLKIIPNSNEHGTALLTVSGLNEEIMEWIEAGFMND